MVSGADGWEETAEEEEEHMGLNPSKTLCGVERAGNGHRLV